MAFHVEQRQAGNEIIDKFTKEQPFTILLAQMQSGKTGTYLFTALEMIRLGLVKNVVVICGSSDTSLRAQTNKDLFGEKKENGEEILGAHQLFQRETIVSGDTVGTLRLMDATIGVHFSQDLQKLGKISEETLVIHDESHMAQSKNNIPFKNFYQKNNLDKALMGDFSELKEKHCYILGVSATPFSEIVANKKVQTGEWTSEGSAFLDGTELSAKNFYFMQPGSGYIGVTDLLKNDSIKFEAENIKSSDCSHIASVLRKGSPKYHMKYIVVRTLCAEKDSSMMQTIASSTGCEYASVFGGEGSLDFMKIKPTMTTLVHICGKFRMGQVVPKEHIAMVYEQSKNPNADTILQGLLGRMCGYRSNGAHTDVDIYVSPTAEELIRKYSRAWEEGVMDELSTVTRALNLGGVKCKNVFSVGEKEWVMTVPIKFQIKDLDQGGVTFKRIIPEHLLSLFRNKPELLTNNPDGDKIKEFLEACTKTNRNRSRKKGPFHNYSPETSPWEENSSSLDNAIDSGKRMNVSHYTQRDIANGMVGNIPPISVYSSHKNQDVCYLMGFVPYLGLDLHGPCVEETSTVDPKCNYHPDHRVPMEDGSVLDDVNGGQIIKFSIDTADDPESLETELEKAILRTIEDSPSYIEGATRAIHSLFDSETRLYEGIKLDKEIYTEEIIQSVKNSLDRKYSLSLVFKKSRGRQPKNHIKYSSISW